MSKEQLETLTEQIVIHRHALEGRLKQAALAGVVPAALVKIVEFALLEVALALYQAEKGAMGDGR